MQWIANNAAMIERADFHYLRVLRRFAFWGGRLRFGCRQLQSFNENYLNKHRLVAQSMRRVMPLMLQLRTRAGNSYVGLLRRDVPEPESYCDDKKHRIAKLEDWYVRGNLRARRLPVGAEFMDYMREHLRLKRAIKEKGNEERP